MPGDSGVLADVAGAILDGSQIDWTSAESSADDTERSLLDPLRLVAAVADLHRQLPAETPEQWGHLRVLEQVGQGTFGRVYRAWDTRLDREVALKLLPAGPPADNARTTSIIEEGRLLARVRHPNVVSIYGAERTEDHVGLWMEFIHGRTLEQLIQDGHVFNQEQAVEIGIQLCRAVDAVHQAGLLHRDIKAHNVMVTDDNRVVLMDFGTGREVGEERVAIAGTPLYLAPEVLAGSDATPASDIYAIGVVLYHLVTAGYPVQASNIGDLRRAHEQHLRADLSAARPDLGAKLLRILDRAIDPQAARRQPTAATLARDLESVRPRSIRVPLRYLAVGAAALVVVASIAAGIRNRQNSESAAATPVAGSTVPTVVDRPIIAVLPLKNLSSDPDNDYLVDGMTDEIIRNLAVVRGLEVRSRTSSFAFKDQPRNLRDIGEQLRANLVVEGSISVSNNRLRVFAQLVQIAGDVPLWSERFDRELQDVFLIQEEISRAIVNKLRLTLGQGQRRYDLDPETYELYVKARALAARHGLADPTKAVEMFGQVIARDPGFAPAYAGLVNAYAWLSMSPYQGASFETAQSIMRPAAVKALELDPMLAEAHAAMGWVASRDFDWEKAVKSFRRAIDLNSSLTDVYSNYVSSTLLPTGRLDEAEQLLQAARQTDPLSVDVLRQLGIIQFVSGQYEEAVTTLRRVQTLDANLPFVKSFLGRALVFAGRPAEAIPILEESGGLHYTAYAYAKAGRRADAEKLAVVHAAYPQRVAVIYAAFEDHDRTFAALERMMLDEPHRVAINLSVPEFAFLHGDPRLAGLRKKLNLP